VVPFCGAAFLSFVIMVIPVTATIFDVAIATVFDAVLPEAGARLCASTDSKNETNKTASNDANAAISAIIATFFLFSMLLPFHDVGGRSVFILLLY
jgi:hypothetical protein